MKAIPINEAEAIFERFMDPLRSQFNRWSVTCNTACGATAGQEWNSAKVSWHTGGGATVSRMRRDLGLELDGCDRLIVRISLPSCAQLTVRARCNGVEKTVIDKSPGADDYSEYEGPVSGTHIESLEMEIAAEGPNPGMALIQWLGITNAGRRDLMRSRPPLFAEDWDDLVIAGAPSMEPKLELFFGADELPAIRERATLPRYAEAMDGLRVRARKWLGSDPHSGVSDIFNMGQPIYGRDGDTPVIDMLAARLCAFVGLMDEDEALLRTAIDHVLAACHCNHWIDGPIMTMPGATHEHRAFVSYRVSVNSVYALDWAGGLLTEAGVQTIAHALAMKGLPACLMSLMRHDYMRRNNQGVYMAYGALAIEAALAKLWPPHGGELMEVAKAAVDETVERYIKPDGGSYEGTGYVSSTVGHALTAYQLYARHRDLPLAEVVPEKLLNTERYFSTMASTVPPAGGSICVGDGGHPGAILFPSFLGSLSRLTDSPTLKSLLAGIMPNTPERENVATPGAVFNIIYGPDELGDTEVVRPPTFSLLPNTGQLCSCRETEDGFVRFQLIGAPPKAGHTHEDKGSFLIEAFGEEIAIDRGQISYNDPRFDTLRHAQFHNLLVPDTAEGIPARQVYPCPHETIPYGSGDKMNLSCGVGGGGQLYPDLVIAWSRTIRSATSTEFDIIDVMELYEPGTVTFHLHSRHPWSKLSSGWETAGRKAILCIEPFWKPAQEMGDEDFIDGDRKPAQHLRLRTTTGKKHELHTRLSVRPAS